MKYLSFIFFLISCSYSVEHRVVNKDSPAKGDILLTDGIAIPKINSGYTVWLPETGEIRGLIVFIHPRRDTINSEFIIDYALSEQLAILYTTTENRLEFFFDHSRMQEIEDYIYEVISTYDIPSNNMMYCGMSLAGTRALRLAMFGNSGDSKYNLVPRTIAICDAPLDMIRFHKEMVKAKELNFNSIAANEGTWVSGYLESNLGGTPSDTPQAYINYSPYSYADTDHTNLDLLNDIAVRCYTEPDVNWWIETRRKDYYAMNALDLAALVNELRIKGNSEAELIITEDKGYLPNGDRHPHTWNIVDEKELVDWFIERMK